MENASKALIIAGAILLAILIIALGVFIFQRAQSATSDLGGIDETKLQSVNQKFENYEGVQTGSDLRALIDLVRTNNNKYPSTDGSNREITVKVTSGEGLSAVEAKGADELGNVKAKVQTGSTYKITMSEYSGGPNGGLVSKIEITEP